MQRHILVVLLLLSIAAPAAAAPQKPPDPEPVAQSVRSLYRMVRDFLAKSARLMPEEHYGFRPTPEVRTFGELVGHVANTQYNFCASVVGTPSPNRGNLEKLTGKAALVDALDAALAYCDQAYDAQSDATLGKAITFGTAPTVVSYSLVFNVAHDFEHYGNMVTYLRLKGLVPPSTAR